MPDSPLSNLQGYTTSSFHPNITDIQVLPTKVCEGPPTQRSAQIRHSKNTVFLFLLYLNYKYFYKCILTISLSQCNFTFNFTNLKRKEQITCHSTSSNTFSSKPSPACRFSSVSHCLRRCQPSSSSVLPSLIPPPATSVPTPAFSFHLRHLLSVTFHFFLPHPKFLLSLSLSLTLPRLLPLAFPPRTSIVTNKRTTLSFFGKFKLPTPLSEGHLGHIPYFICFAYATCKVRCLSTRGLKQHLLEKG